MRSILRGRRLRTVARGPMASVASQATGLLQLVLLLLLHGGATSTTDVYFYLFSVGLAPALILVVGVMYPLLLNERSASRAGLQRIRTSAPVLAAAAVLVGTCWLTAHRTMSVNVLLIAAVMAVNAALQARLYFYSVAAEAGGDPLWISAIALPANTAACLALLLPWSNSTNAVMAMVTALLLGNAGCLVWLRRMQIGQHVLDAAPVEQERHTGSVWFFARSSVGYVGQIVLSSLAVLLPASGVTLLSLATKVVGASSTTLTNAVMPVLVHKTTETPAAARRFLHLLVITLGGLGAAGVLVVATVDRSQAVPAVVIALWVVAASAAAVAQRTSFRFLPARAAGSTLFAVAVIVALAVGASWAPGFDITVLLCVYAALDAATAALLLRPLKDRFGFAVTALLLTTFVGLGIYALR